MSTYDVANTATALANCGAYHLASGQIWPVSNAPREAFQSARQISPRTVDAIAGALPPPEGTKMQRTLEVMRIRGLSLQGGLI